MKVRTLVPGDFEWCDNCGESWAVISIYIVGKGYTDLCDACREELRAALGEGE